MKPSRLDDTTRIDTRSRPAAPRPTLRPPPVQDDEGATRVYTAPVKLEVAPPSSRARNSFPEPPRDRPRVFEREAQMDVTTLRPSRSDERTELRPQMSSDAPPPMPSRPSIAPSTYSVPALEVSVDLPAIVAASRTRIAAIAAVATAAPFALVLALLGSVDRPIANAMAATQPAVAQALAFIAEVTPPVPAPIAEPAAVVASAKRFPSIAPVTPAVAPPPRPPTPTAVAAAPPTPRPAAYAYAAAPSPRPAAPAPRPAAPKAKVPGATTELPDAQAADALARAQLEAALR